MPPVDQSSEGARLAVAPPLDSLRELVRARRRQGDVEVASWCGPCCPFTAVVEALADKYDGHFRFAKLDVDEDPDIALAYGVEGRGQPRRRRTGDPQTR